ncbi:MAG: phenylacetate-CoA oxygenase subunit PaaC [Chloroflexi bacterium]|nr:phenylacetate-CoA oxygenase subunit PaaC [Chloroflexota bacterium]
MTNLSLVFKILALADDELILGHRNSEWAGHAPILEEDIAFANLALDELGHAQLWYALYQEFTDTEPDYLVFFRGAADYRNAQFVELPKGDWAFSMLRQYLFDTYESIALPQLVKSSNARIAEIAAKIRPEEMYHLRHTSNWVKRLGLGTAESHRRMQNALDELWAYALQLFVPLSDEQELIDAKVMPDPRVLQAEWESQVVAHLSASGLIVPATREPIATSRTQHTEYLTALLAEMQEVARGEVYGVEW